MFIFKRVLLYLILLTAVALVILLYTSSAGVKLSFPPLLKKTKLGVVESLPPRRTTVEAEPELHSLEYIRKHHLFPNNPAAPTNYSGGYGAWKQAMAKTVAKRLKFKRNGFFLECGAFDGVFISNSLHLERKYGWTGLLVEADPASVPKLKWRNRRAWVADVCLSSKPQPTKAEMIGHHNVPEVSYFNNKVIGRGERTAGGGYNRTIQVQCYPLAMLMDAIGRSQIDYLSLDVEGMELDILKTIPFQRILIKLISVEVRGSQGEDIKRFLEPIGYKRIEQLRIASDFMHDDLYELQKPVNVTVN